jgi:hypothetical protein
VVTTVLHAGMAEFGGEEVKKPETMVDQFETVTDTEFKSYSRYLTLGSTKATCSLLHIFMMNF